MAKLTDLFRVNTVIDSQRGYVFKSLKEYLTDKYYTACNEVKYHSGNRDLSVAVYEANMLNKIIPCMRCTELSDLDTIERLKATLPQLGIEAEMWYKNHKNKK